ncbi:MAG: DUF169 domain-containing protein [Methanomicrobiales archaeon]|nr:DUF169 domain-containing protein [Methanomicrobiales archaeon]
MEDKLRIPLDYPSASDRLKALLSLTGSPVAIRFLQSREEVPAGVPEQQGELRHCQMVNLARKEGKVFYAPSERHLCAGGAWALGIRPISTSLRTGEFYFKLGKFASYAASMRTIKRIPHVEEGTTYATLYAPLEKTPVPPHVVLVIAPPRVMLKIAQSALFRTGGRITSTFSGIQSVCADTTAQTYLTGVVNFSLGCDGSRRFSGISDDEMVVGIPAELLGEVVEAVAVVTMAPGSK